MPILSGLEKNHINIQDIATPQEKKQKQLAFSVGEFLPEHRFVSLCEDIRNCIQYDEETSAALIASFLKLFFPTRVAEIPYTYEHFVMVRESYLIAIPTLTSQDVLSFLRFLGNARGFFPEEVEHIISSHPELIETARTHIKSKYEFDKGFAFVFAADLSLARGEVEDVSYLGKNPNIQILEDVLKEEWWSSGVHLAKFFGAAINVMILNPEHQIAISLSEEAKIAISDYLTDELIGEAPTFIGDFLVMHSLTHGKLQVTKDGLKIATISEEEQQVEESKPPLQRNF